MVGSAQSIKVVILLQGLHCDLLKYISSVYCIKPVSISMVRSMALLSFFCRSSICFLRPKFSSSKTKYSVTGCSLSSLLCWAVNVVVRLPPGDRTSDSLVKIGMLEYAFCLESLVVAGVFGMLYNAWLLRNAWFWLGVSDLYSVTGRFPVWKSLA